jgi:predicted enzyme related to lactoylglutathione lyase
MSNKLIFVDLPVSDTVAADAFYTELFGWTINPRPLGEFHQIVPEEGLHLGLFSTDRQYPDPMPKSDPAPPGLHARTYILVDNSPTTYLKRALELGATPAWDERWWAEFSGWHASFYDPWGNHIVMWENTATRSARLGIPEEDLPDRG